VKFILLLLLFVIGAAAHPSDNVTCANLLASGGYKVILKQAHDLGLVKSVTEPVPLEQLYLRLKTAEWTEADIEQLRSSLLAARQRQFQIDTMSAPELQQFYQNAIHALYIRVVDLWRTQEVRMLVGPVMRRDVEEALSRMLAREFSPWGLEHRELTPEAAREHFRTRKWMMQPWSKYAVFLTEWFEGHPEKFDAREFSKFWDQKASVHALNFEMYQRFYMALNRAVEPSICCLSEPGCVACPHNRRWRR